MNASERRCFEQGRNFGVILGFLSGLTVTGAISLIAILVFRGYL